MAGTGTRRRPRRPTISKLLGSDYKTRTESKSEEETRNRRNKMQHYTPKKKVILLPGTVLGQEPKEAQEKKE